jgi:VIT1/CCC1 family predicted Fe2+/Mn2+ transporter
VATTPDNSDSVLAQYLGASMQIATIRMIALGVLAAALVALVIKVF